MIRIGDVVVINSEGNPWTGVKFKVEGIRLTDMDTWGKIVYIPPHDNMARYFQYYSMPILGEDSGFWRQRWLSTVSMKLTVNKLGNFPRKGEHNAGQ